MKKKIEYHRLTFVLSVIGFIGSICFYVGVLRKVYGKSHDSQQIETLRKENAELKNTVRVLTNEILENDEQGKQ